LIIIQDMSLLRKPNFNEKQEHTLTL